MATRTSRRHPALPRAVLPALLGITVVLLIAFGASACQSFAGGPVLSAAEYRERVAATEEAGEEALRDLSPAPAAGDGVLDEVSGSCVDDFGFDDTGVTRDEPSYEWSLDFTDRSAYLRAVENLHRTWSERGLDVERVEPDKDSGLPGISTTTDGIRLTLAPDWYSDRPVLRVNGGCLRHEYDFHR
ncbi:hypothetical protein [Streptomyces sp. JB150]|uniref:hypothetical protein n=1 Tax=Streptomyces sp. JB150 TaxID=2714844 RepID=UPI00140B475E|nr:hypothetical protein [Streptomyces sp. JB150]QIJ64195.1 hypothetical protein G7Z13_20930 [Streptomyces sp. JB150]